MYKTKSDEVSRYKTAVRLSEILDHMQVNEQYLMQTTDDPDSLFQSSRKQILTGDLQI